MRAMSDQRANGCGSTMASVLRPIAASPSRSRKSCAWPWKAPQNNIRNKSNGAERTVVVKINPLRTTAMTEFLDNDRP